MNDVGYVTSLINNIVEENKIPGICEYIEQTRYLPSSVTASPGFMDLDKTPYCKEILECFHPDHPIQDVTVLKGAQVAYTTAILENIILFWADAIGTQPMMYVTADNKMTKMRVDNYIIPMFNNSNLREIIKSSDAYDKRKTGKTADYLQFEKGGRLLMRGAKQPTAFRSDSTQILLEDEIDGWGQIVGNDGDVMELINTRTAAYPHNKKILRGSTPLIKQTSHVDSYFMRADRREYNVNCISCGYQQPVKFKTLDKKTGVIGGLVWETDGGILVPGSVRWKCANCGRDHTEEEKDILLSDGAEWVPNKKSTDEKYRSYRIPALISKMITWEENVKTWRTAWNDETNKPKNLAQLQVFWNNVLGEAYDQSGRRLSYRQVIVHRRSWYSSGEIPDVIDKTGHKIELLVCTVDVGRKKLSVSVFGWTRSFCVFLIEYIEIEGDTTDINDQSWVDLRDYVANREFKRGNDLLIPEITVIDTGDGANPAARDFVNLYGEGLGISAIKGLPSTGQNQSSVRQLSAYENGVSPWGIIVDLYKDRWSSQMRNDWDGISVMPRWSFNAPNDITDKQMKELASEYKSEVKDRNGKIVKYEWIRPNGTNTPNELWDLLMYANAAIDILAYNLCLQRYKLSAVDFNLVFDELGR